MTLKNHYPDKHDKMELKKELQRYKKEVEQVIQIKHGLTKLIYVYSR